MISPTICILTFCTLSVFSSPVGDYEAQLAKDGVDVNKMKEFFEKESKEVREEFAGVTIKTSEKSTLPAGNNTIHFKTETEVNEEMASDLFEGDIKLSPSQWERAMDLHPNKSLTRRQSIADIVRLWQPIGAPIVPYTYVSTFPESGKKVVEAAIAYWEKFTCVRFRRATSTDRNLIEFNHLTDGCWSNVGMAGGKQTISLQENGCMSVATAAHEMSHAFGTLHVQSRSDRDNYVMINVANIKPKSVHNFAKEPSDFGKLENHGIPYDFGSGQHYDSRAFAIDRNQYTIYAKPAYSLFQESMEGPEPTFYDILTINKMYKCERKCQTTTLKCENNGVQSPSNCNECICPKGYSGRTCSTRSTDATIVKVSGSSDQKVDIPASANRMLNKKLFIFEAPVGKRIRAVVSRIGDYMVSPCRSIGFEVIPFADTRKGGFRYCGKVDQRAIESESNTLMVFGYNMEDISLWASIKITVY